MEIDLARHIVRATFRSSAELQSLLPLAKKQCSAEEYATLLQGIGTTLATMGQDVTNPVLAACPGLSADIDAILEKYGRYL